MRRHHYGIVPFKVGVIDLTEDEYSQKATVPYTLWRIPLFQAVRLSEMGTRPILNSAPDHENNRRIESHYMGMRRNTSHCHHSLQYFA